MFVLFPSLLSIRSIVTSSPFLPSSLFLLIYGVTCIDQRVVNYGGCENMHVLPNDASRQWTINAIYQTLGLLPPSRVRYTGPKCSPHNVRVLCNRKRVYKNWLHCTSFVLSLTFRVKPVIKEIRPAVGRKAKRRNSWTVSPVTVSRGYPRFWWTRPVFVSALWSSLNSNCYYYRHKTNRPSCWTRKLVTTWM
jgi:hypothetical protein